MKQQYVVFRKHQLTKAHRKWERKQTRHNFRSWNKDGQAVTNLADPKKRSLKLKISKATNDPVYTLKSPKGLKT